MNWMSPVSLSQSSSIASEVQPVSSCTAKRGAKSRPLTVPPTKMAEGLYLRESTVKALAQASVLKYA